METHENAVMKKRSVSQTRDMPNIMRRALSLLSAECMLTGSEDLGCSIHEFSALATRPPCDWGVSSFSDASFKHRDLILIDQDFGVPTTDCVALAEKAGSEIMAWEDLHHDMLRSIVNGFKKKADEVYTEIRQFIVRNPAVRYDKLQRFITDNLLTGSVNDIINLYRPVPLSYQANGKAVCCARCHSLLYPERDKSLYPHGRCRVRQCAAKYPSFKPGTIIEDPSTWRIANNDVLAYWVGPGLDEISILKKVGVQRQSDLIKALGDIGILTLSPARKHE